MTGFFFFFRLVSLTRAHFRADHGNDVISAEVSWSGAFQLNLSSIGGVSPLSHPQERGISAYVIAPTPLFDKMRDVLVQLGMNPQRIEPIEPASNCKGKGKRREDLMRYGIELAHQSAWSRILQTGKPALVVESDATISGAPVDQVKQRLQATALDIQRSSSPEYVSVGWCPLTGVNGCTTAYFMNPKLAKISLKIDFCASGISNEVDGVIGHMCESNVAKCTWVPRLSNITLCAGCFGEGVFFQNRSLRGLHDERNHNGHDRFGSIRPNETRETRAGMQSTLVPNIPSLAANNPSKTSSSSSKNSSVAE